MLHQFLTLFEYKFVTTDIPSIFNSFCIQSCQNSKKYLIGHVPSIFNSFCIQSCQNSWKYLIGHVPSIFNFFCIQSCQKSKTYLDGYVPLIFNSICIQSCHNWYSIQFKLNLHTILSKLKKIPNWARSINFYFFCIQSCHCSKAYLIGYIPSILNSLCIQFCQKWHSVKIYCWLLTLY